MKPRPWTNEEDRKLRDAVEIHGRENWLAVSRHVGGNRSRAQCAQRWVRGLDPAVSKSKWTDEEDRRLIDLVKEYGERKWAAIAAHMGSRCDVQCRYRYKRLAKGSPLRHKSECPEMENIGVFCHPRMETERFMLPSITTFLEGMEELPLTLDF
jgi:hypothetical protein